MIITIRDLNNEEQKINTQNHYNKLLYIDCLKFMKTCKNNQFDLAIVDPPYGLERFKHGGSVVNKYGDESREWNNTKPTKEYFDELFRVSKNQIIWGGNNFSLPTSEYFIIWQKSNAEDFSFAMCEMAWTSCRVPAKVFLHYHVNSKDVRIHPTQKPVALYKWLLSHYAHPGDKLLDTHSGSGSFRIAAYDMGFNLISCELDHDYCVANEKRFHEYIQQQDLFTPKEYNQLIFDA